MINSVFICLFLINFCYFFNKFMDAFSISYNFGMLKKNNINKLKSLIVILNVIFVYFILYRILRIVFSPTQYLDIDQTMKFFNYFGFSSLVEFAIITFTIFFIFIKIKKRVDIIVRYHFLVVYYNFFEFHKITIFIQKLESKIIAKFTNNFSKYIIYLYLRDNFLKLLIAIFFFKGCIFDHGLVYLGYIKYFFVVSILLSVYKFFLRFVVEFDTGVVMIHNSKMFSLTVLGKQNLDLYIKYLIYQKSNYVFFSSNMYNDFKQESNVKFYYSCPQNNSNQIISLIKESNV